MGSSHGARRLGSIFLELAVDNLMMQFMVFGVIGERIQFRLPRFFSSIQLNIRASETNFLENRCFPTCKRSKEELETEVYIFMTKESQTSDFRQSKL